MAINRAKAEIKARADSRKVKAAGNLKAKVADSRRAKADHNRAARADLKAGRAVRSKAEKADRVRAAKAALADQDKEGEVDQAVRGKVAAADLEDRADKVAEVVVAGRKLDRADRAAAEGQALASATLAAVSKVAAEARAVRRADA